MRCLASRCALSWLVFLFALPVAQAQDSRMGEIWSDPSTGFAIGGYDPVSYFVHRVPLQGRTGVELVIDGVAWKFLNQANKAVFARDPEVYAPRLAGRDPLQLARGFEAIGNPHNWLIQNGALFLFTTPKSRSAWLAASEGERKQAAANWSGVIKATQ